MTNRITRESATPTCVLTPHFFFSALHFLVLSLVPVTVPLIGVAEVTLPEKCANIG